MVCLVTGVLREAESVEGFQARPRCVCRAARVLALWLGRLDSDIFIYKLVMLAVLTESDHT